MSSIADRARSVTKTQTTVMDHWLASHKNPDALRKEVVEALSDPTISYRAVLRVLREDGLSYRDASSLRDWWTKQPEYTDDLR